MKRTKNTRNMLKVFLAVITILVCLSIACEDSSSTMDEVRQRIEDDALKGIENTNTAFSELADEIDRKCDEANIPNNLSGEVYDWIANQ